MKQKSRSFKVALIVLVLLLAVSLCACSSLATFLLKNATQNAGTNANTQTQTQTQTDTGTDTGSDDPDLYRPNAGKEITQSDTVATEHGSAGDQVFTISEVVRKVQDSVVQIYVSSNEGTSAGSGVIISAEYGYILTCNHVVAGGKSIVVELSDNTQYSAKLVGTDASTDLAVVKIEPSAERPLTEAVQGKSSGLVAGEYVVAIGNPLGTLGGSVSQGIISATARQIPFSNDDGSTTVMTLLQTDAAINSGNSGGGLFNLQGELIGIVNSKYSNTGVEGLGFAIPIDTIYPIEIDLIEYGYVRGIVDDGLSMFSVSEMEYWYYQWQYRRVGINSSGLYVNSSRYTDGLRQYDRIVSVNGQTVNTVDDYRAVVSKLEIGDTIEIQYSRGQTTGTVQITLQEYKPEGK